MGAVAEGRTAFVTGASGFIGRHLTAVLAERGWRVRCLVRPTSVVRPLRRVGAELHRGDVLQPTSLESGLAGVDAVFHLAGLTEAWTLADFMRVNAEGTWNVARACAARVAPPVLVVCSSLASAGPIRRGAVRTEADPLAPTSAYGRSKRAGELAAESCADRVPTTILRPGIVFGEWNRLMLPMFRTIARTGIHFVPTFAPPPLSLIHVRDLAELLVAAAERGTRIAPRQAGERPHTRPSGYYFATMAEYPTWVQLGRMTAQFLGRRHVCLFHLAEPLPWIIAAVNELIGRWRGRHEIVTWDKMREAIVPSWASSPAAASQDLAFAPAWSLGERWRQTVEWYQARGWL
jgi:nucleoside-diphosphate-sugar epimerase